VTDSLAEILNEPGKASDIPVEEIPLLLSNLAALQNVLTARLLEVSGRFNPTRTSQEDRLLDAKQAAELLRKSADWLYRHKSKLPFTVRVGRNIRFSHDGLQKYLRQRQGR
jgi:predicted DNA-binding transcriptional regulator AlpA